MDRGGRGDGAIIPERGEIVVEEFTFADVEQAGLDWIVFVLGHPIDVDDTLAHFDFLSREADNSPG
jgi:hypothetical protein